MPNCMNKCSFRLQPFRQTIGDGVKLELKGDFEGMGSCFSVNFVFEDGIAYHFGVRLHGKGHHEVFQGYKDNTLEWEELNTEVWPSEDAKKNLTIHLSGDEISVLVDGNRTQLKVFDRKVPFEVISCIELWDDINWVEEIKLKLVQ